MGNLGEDTAVEGSDGRYTAAFHKDWEIWGPNGGYVAAVALRAAGVHSSQPRPASLVCHYLGVGAFDAVDIEAVSLRTSKRAESVRVSITQKGNAIAEALVWCVADDLSGLSHDALPMPEVAKPADLKSVDQLRAEEGVPQPPFGFWRNLEERPPNWLPWEEFVARGEFRHEMQTWMKFRPQATFENDPFVDACRSVIMIDTWQWPAASRGYKPGTLTHTAPSLDLAVSFHALDPSAEWLLVNATSPYAADGLVGGRAELWSEAGVLLATGGQQMLCRPLPPNPRG